MTNNQMNTLNRVKNELLEEYRIVDDYTIKSVEVHTYDFCKDVHITLVIGIDDMDSFDDCYMFLIGPRGGLSRVNSRGKVVRCNSRQLRSIW